MINKLIIDKSYRNLIHKRDVDEFNNFFQFKHPKKSKTCENIVIYRISYHIRSKLLYKDDRNSRRQIKTLIGRSKLL